MTDVTFDVEGADGGDTLSDEKSLSSTGIRGGARKGRAIESFFLSIQQAPRCEVDSKRANVRNIRQKTFAQDEDQSVFFLQLHSFAAKD